MELKGYDAWKLSNAYDRMTARTEVEVSATFHLLDTDGLDYTETFCKVMTLGEAEGMGDDTAADVFADEIEGAWELYDGQVITYLGMRY